MEYMVVNYRSTRTVLIDGQEAGGTGQPLMVEAGHHKIALAGDQDYTPGDISREALSSLVGSGHPSVRYPERHRY